MTDPLRELPAAFAGRSVFVTGHTGFKGAWLSLWLSRLGARVTGYALAPSTEPSAFVAGGVRDVLAAHHEADIRDGERLVQAMRACTPDVVLHLAAQPLVRASYEQPRETFDVNVVGTASVLDAVRALGRPCVVVVVTSDKCYDNREHVFGYRETDPLGGLDPYSASKGAAEIVVASYRQSFFPSERVRAHGVKLASVRAGNVIGGGDWAQDRIVADIARSLSSGRPVPVRNPLSLRPWQHVLEPLGGYLLLAARMQAAPDDAR
ncbi:MAG TPA: CDP-glucose 4,6-dehydratase, partial [Polyangia bacterium]